MAKAPQLMIVKVPVKQPMYMIGRVPETAAFHLTHRALLGWVSVTECGLRWSRKLPQFKPHEATCKECLRNAGIR